LLEKLRQPATPARPSKQITHSVTVQPADKSERDNLLSDINKSKQSAESLAQRFFKILDQHYTYAQATGDSYFFITTLSNLGTCLLKRHRFTPAILNHLQQMIERGLSLEPMDPFIWMLWANCLAHLNQPEAQEWVLRETVRLFPNNEPSRVELARLLMRQGDDLQAEKWLRDVIAISPNHGHSRVMLAQFLARRGKTSEAEELLTTFLARNSQNPKAREVLEHIQQGRVDFTELDFEVEDASDEYAIARPFRFVKTTGSFKRHEISSLSDATQISPSSVAIPQPSNLPKINSPLPQKIATESVTEVTSDADEAMNTVQLSSLEQLLQELQRRAVLHTAFEHEEQFATIQQNAVEGDALACFYRQWLKPHEDPKLPPHAWAAHACRLYQTTDAPAMQWEQLNRDFPEKQLLNRFLQVRQTEDQHKSQQLFKKLKHDSESLNPLEKFMFQVLQPNHGYTHDKDKSVLSVLSSAAIGAPQVASEL